jgi:hypothetical protein
VEEARAAENPIYSRSVARKLWKCAPNGTKARYRCSQTGTRLEEHGMASKKT